MNNYDFKILKFICESYADHTDPVRACDVELKFGSAGKAAAVSLYKERLISWALSEDDTFFRDEYGVIKPTEKGLLEYERFHYDRQLKSREIWRERIFGTLFGILSTVAAEMLIRFLVSLK